jgi:1L-myo-inositol 1-phosphate cytidylyltransferase
MVISRQFGPTRPERPAPVPPSAVILAAGEGTRLRSTEDAPPKPLTCVGGVSLLERAVLMCRDAGVSDIVVVIGFGQSELLPVLTELRVQHHVRIRPAISEHWPLGNGASVLAAEPYVRDPFFLMMCDHVVDPRFLAQLLAADDGRRPCAVVVDRQLDAIADIEEATKVCTEGASVVAIGKDLPAYDAIDTGVFLCRSGLFEALHLAASQGRHTLSDGIQLMATRGQASCVDSLGMFWVDVDTEVDRDRAERILFAEHQRVAPHPAGMLDIAEAASY